MGNDHRSQEQVQAARKAALGKRQFGRLKCTMAHCTLGEIQDISAGGMRVMARSRPVIGQTIETVLLTQHGALPIKCSVRWCKRVRFFWYELGVMFSEVDAPTRRVISEFARIAADGEMVRSEVAGWIDEHKRAG